MNDVLQALLIGFPILWIVEAVFFGKQYFDRRRAAKEKGPMTAQEREEHAKMAEELARDLPRKEVKPAWYYFLHPQEGVRMCGAGLVMLPFFVVFLPLVVMMWCLPNPNRR
jgi:hypothetical protein